MIRSGIFLSFSVILMMMLVSKAAHAQSFKELEKTRDSARQHAQDTSQVMVLLKRSKDLIMLPNITKAQIYNAEKVLARGRQLSVKLRYTRGQGYAMLVQALVFKQKSDAPNSIKTALLAIPFFVKINDIAGQADAYNIVGDVHSNSDEQLVPKVLYFKKAIGLYARSGQKERAANLLTYLGDLEIWTGKYGEAINHLHEALTLFREINNKNVQGTYDLLGYGYLHMGNLTEALKYNLLAVQAAENNGESSTMLCTIYNRTATTYSYAENLPKCIEYTAKARQAAYMVKDTTAIILISFNLAAAMIRNNTPVSAIPIINSVKSFKLVGADTTWHARYATLLLKANLLTGNLTASKIYLDDCIKLLSSKSIEHNVYAEIFTGIILYYQLTNQYEKTYPYIAAHIKYRKDEKLTIRADDDDDQRLFKADSAMGKMLSAVRHLQRYMFFTDSVKSAKNRKQASLLEIQFEADKKDRDIQFKAKNIKLLTQQTQLQQVSFRQERIIRNWIIAATILLLLMIGVLYNRFRLKQRTNRFLESQHLALKIKQEEINQQNEDLVHLSDRQQTLLKEKEWLLREIHHRVKNNLQITMSLLNIQSSYLDNGLALDAIANSQRRMQSMSLIHTKLYQSENLAYIDMSDYIPELVGYIKDSFNEGDFIVFELNVPPFQLDISQAIPIGLVLNEALTNAIKYAFKGRSFGRIKVVMEQDENEVYSLIIADNGIGIPDEGKIENRNTLGMNLMRGLASQIQGELFVENNNGTVVTVRFRDLKLMAEEFKTDQTVELAQDMII